MKKQSRRNMKKGILLALLIMALAAFAGCGQNDEKATADDTEQTVTIESSETESSTVEISYTFRYDDYLQEHYEKHGREMGFGSPEEYLEAANAVISNPEALTKTEEEDGDMVYYVEKTNEFVVLSTDGYIRTYFNPSGGIDYFYRQ